MTYRITFYARRTEGGETVLSTHVVEQQALIAYTGTPGIVLETFRTIRGQKADGFRITDMSGRVVLLYVGSGQA